MVVGPTGRTSLARDHVAAVHRRVRERVTTQSEYP
jgi:hypothetical protein